MARHLSSRLAVAEALSDLVKLDTFNHTVVADEAANQTQMTNTL